MELKDWLIILATLLSPVIAVQVTRYLDNIKEEKDRKLDVFKTLMATRKNWFHYSHVNALNLIDIEFSDKKSKKVRDAWRAYLDSLINREAHAPEVIAKERERLLVDLLYEMGNRLQIDFNKTDLKNSHYTPQLYLDNANEEILLRQKFIELISRENGIPIEVKKYPISGTL